MDVPSTTKVRQFIVILPCRRINSQSDYRLLTFLPISPVRGSIIDFIHFFLGGGRTIPIQLQDTVFSLISAPGAFEIEKIYCHSTLQLTPPFDL